jgi:hypothetical protein
MPVYSQTDNSQVAVVVMKKTFMLGFIPAKKDCLDENGNLVEQDAIFQNEDEANNFIEHLKSVIE